MYLTCKHTGEPIPVDWKDILDYTPHEDYTSLLIGKYPQYDFDYSSWVDVRETIEEIEDEMIWGNND